MNRDITERKRAEEQLEHNLFHDPMTGLPNRRLFLDRLQNAFVRSRWQSLSFLIREVRASLSLGIAMSTVAHAKPEDLLKDADVAMRRAKALGGSRCEVFDEAMHSRTEGRLRLEADLRSALDQRQFRLHYQPVVQLNTRAVTSFEALLRWERPTQGLISPYRFIEAAEDSGILVSVGHWFLLRACRQLREWQANNFSGEPVNITVNVSARQFADAQLANDIPDALPGNWHRSLTAAIGGDREYCRGDPKLTITVLSHLKHMGIGVILDDFGIGPASLRGLRQFPLDALKIDRSLIREMQTDRSASDMVEMIIPIAHKMGLRVIAEGIEGVRRLSAWVSWDVSLARDTTSRNGWRQRRAYSLCLNKRPQCEGLRQNELDPRYVCHP